jgi:hypothetical protein
MCPHTHSCFAGYWGGCSGVAGGVSVVAGGVVVGASVGGDAGSRYHTTISARTTAAAMISTLFVSITHPLYCYAKDYRALDIRTRLAIQVR